MVEITEELKKEYHDEFHKGDYSHCSSPLCNEQPDGEPIKYGDRTLRYYIDRSHEQAGRTGFHEVSWSIGDMLLLIVSEITEGFEEFRAGHAAQEVYYPDKLDKKPEGLPIELADACIRIFDLAGRLNIDLESCIVEKLDYNLTRSERHGGKRV